MDAGELFAQPARDDRLDQPAQAVGQTGEAEVRQNVEKLAIGEQACHDRRYFGVGVGSDGFEFVHHALCKGNEERACSAEGTAIHGTDRSRLAHTHRVNGWFG